MVRSSVTRNTVSWRRIGALVLAALMCFGTIAAAVAVILPMLTASAAEATPVAQASSDVYDFDDNICLSVFWPPTSDYINDEQYRLMAEAGINWVMGGGDNLGAEATQKKMLELCEKYGIGMTVAADSFGANLLGKTEKQIAGYVSVYEDYAAAKGYYIKDEPVNPNQYIDAYIALKKAAPEASMHLNFLPAAAYGSLEKYKAQMNDWCALTAAAGYPIEYLTFDNYPFPLSGEMRRADFFNNVRACWEVGLENDVKTGLYIQAVRQDVSFRRPSANEIRYEMYASLAFGYKQLSFFTWFTPVNRDEPFSDGIISPEGVPNEHYYDIKEINQEILAIGTTLVKCDALDVWFNGSDTYGQPAVPEDFFVQADKNDRIILSALRHRETGRNYIMVVNNNYYREQEVELTFDKAITSLSEVSREDGSLESLSMDGQTLTLTLAAGDAMLIALPEGFDAYPTEEGQPTAEVNLAADAYIVCSASSGTDGYICALNDGERIAGAKSEIIDWRTTNSNDVYIVLDLKQALSFNRIDLYAGGNLFEYGAHFPRTVKVSVSNDGKTYTEVETFADLTAGDHQGNALTFATQTARYIRLDITDMERRDMYIALNEIEVYHDDGTLPAPEQFSLTGENDPVIDYTEGENIALNKNVYASSSAPDLYKQWGFSLEYVNDGLVSGHGYTSNVGRNNRPKATEFVIIDMGDVFAVDKVVVRPTGTFAVDYTVDVSLDGINWTTIYEMTKDPNDGADVVITPDTPVNGRFLRFHATKLRMAGNNTADGYLLQIGDIEAYGTPVCDKTVLENAMATYRAEGGDESNSILAEAVAALEDGTLTQSQANDIAKRLLSLVEPETEPDTEPPTEPPTEPDSDPESDPAAETTTASESATAPEVGSATESEAGGETGGCASAVGASALFLLLPCGAVLLRTRGRRREDV